MRRVGWLLAAAAVGVFAPTPALGAGLLAAAAETVCTVSDTRVTELSGLVATSSGYVAVNDSQWDPAATRVFYLDQRCRVTRTLRYPTPARDPEDLAVAPDGTLWVGDIGDNNVERETVALWRVPPGGGAPVIYRLSYPDRPHDAEALLFTADGQPLIITKELAGPANLYLAAGPLRANTREGTPLKHVGTFMPVATGVPNNLGGFGEELVTGAATSPDRSRVALRTYAATYEWDVPDGDIVKAITTTRPRVTAMPDEPQGEAVAYTPDGREFLTVNDEPGKAPVRRYARSTTLAPTAAESSTPPATTAAVTPAAGPSTPADTNPLLWYGAAAVGLLLAGAGVLGLRRSRRPQG